MKAKALYLVVIVALLLAGCSPASLGLAPIVAGPALLTQAVSAPAAPAADSGHGQAAPAAIDQGQGGDQGGGVPPAAAFAERASARARRDLRRGKSRWTCPARGPKVTPP